MFSVSLNNAMFNCGDQSILQCALDNNILINHSCLTGRCGLCKAKIINGETTTSMFEYGLSSAEKSDNYILTCIRKPVTNLSLDLDALLNIKLPISRTLPAKIENIENVSTDVIKLSLKLPPSVDFFFLPGQYVNVIKGAIKRSYSIASKDKNTLNFLIRIYPNGLFSHYLRNEAKVSDLLRIEGPKGTFFLRKNDEKKNIVFFATGTGIAPIISILEDEVSKNILTEKEVFLFHGARFKEELLLRSFFEDNSINYYPVLSRESISGCHFGYVQNIFMQTRIDIGNSVFYACGSEGMINDSRDLLLSNGLESNYFISDAFLVSE